jgi:hypothetical protein
MKTTAISLLVVILLATTNCVAQNKITVEAQNNDISNNLDLKAVASIFGESKDLQDFEMKLNDYDSQISNLDLNNDGEVDYLRVIESSENNVHLVVIQAVLDRDVYQDVATIVVEKRENRRTYVQIIGDPYMYGNNYIVEPVYVYTPYIYSFFWGNNYRSWTSPYYWGYYPTYYHNRHPFEINIYLSNIHSHINQNHRYYYTEHRRFDDYDRMYNTVSRRDYEKKFPDRTFNHRNDNVTNKQGLDNRRDNKDNNLQTRPSAQGIESSTRPGRTIESTNGSRRGDYESGSRNTTPTIESRPRGNTQNSGITQPQIETNGNRTGRETYQTPSTNSNSGSRSTNPVMRDENSRRNPSTQSTRETYQIPSTNSNSGSRSTTPVVRENNKTVTSPAANQPTRSVETKQVERRVIETPRENDKPENSNANRSSKSDSNRR